MPTLAVANNNPGNIKDPSTGQFHKFSSPQEGYAALLNDLETKKSGKSTTGLGPTSSLVDFASKYAPASDRNNPGQYAANLANYLKIRPDATLGQIPTPNLAAAVAHAEDQSSPFGNVPPPIHAGDTQNEVLGASTQSVDPVSGVPTNRGKGNLGQQAADAVTTLFPGKQLGEAIGNSLAGPVGAISPLLQGKFEQANDTYQTGLLMGAQANSSPKQVEKVGGDVTQAIALPATLAMGGGTGASIPARVATAGIKYGIGGFLSGAGNEASKGGSAKEVGWQGVKTGSKTGLFGAGGQAASEVAGLLAKTPGFQNIIENISPNMTKSAQQSAMAEGRVTRGESSVLFGTKPDIVDTPDDVFKQAATIDRNIPDARDMDDAETASAIHTKTTGMAQELGPQLEALPIDQQTTNEIFDNARAIKGQQQAASDFSDFSGSIKEQEKFERYLNQLQWDTTNPMTGEPQMPTPKNGNTLWKTRIQYDDSIPENVKNATPDQERLYWYKQMWLQNRSILNQAIERLGKTLTPTVGQRFSDMNDLYNARQTIIKNTKINTKGTPGLLKSGVKTVAKYALPALGATGLAGAYAEHLIEKSIGQ